MSEVAERIERILAKPRPSDTYNYIIAEGTENELKLIFKVYPLTYVEYLEAEGMFPKELRPNSDDLTQMRDLPKEEILTILGKKADDAPKSADIQLKKMYRRILDFIVEKNYPDPRDIQMVKMLIDSDAGIFLAMINMAIDVWNKTTPREELIQKKTSQF